jgi:hypothetical protein
LPFIERVSASLRESGELTQAKINEIIAAIKARFQNVNWTTMQAQQQKTYLEQLREDIGARSEQTKDQVNNVVSIVSKTLEEYLTSIKAYLSPSASEASKSASSVYSEAAATASSAKSSVASATDNAKASAASATNNAQKTVHKWLRDNERSLFEKKGYAQAHIDWVENYLINKFKNAEHITAEEVNDAVTTIQHYLEKSADVTEKQVKATVDQIRHGLQRTRDEL